MGRSIFDEPETELTERQRRRAEEKAHQQRADLERVLSSPEGRRFVWRVITAAGTFGASFTGELATGAYAEGRRAVGIALMQEAQRVAPALYLQMLHEEIDAAAREELERQLEEERPKAP